MEWVETTGQSIEEAQAKALDLLNVDGSDAEIEILEDVKKGLFGRVKSDARVRARIRPKAPAPKDDRRNRRGGNTKGRNEGRNRNQKRSGGGGNKSGGNRDSGGGNNRSGGDGQDKSNDQGGNRGGNRNAKSGGEKSGSDRGNGGNRGGGGGQAAAAVAGGAAVAASGRDTGDQGANNDQSASNNQGGNNDRGSNDTRSGTDKSNGGSASRGSAGNEAKNGRGGRNREESTVDEEFSVSDQQQIMQDFVGGVAVIFDADASTEVVDLGDDTLEAQVSGEDLGLLVGPSGATLAALEELTRTALQRSAGGRRYHRIHVDVDKYKSRRREALGNFAMSVADQVKDSGERKSLEPMNAADRKVVHDALTDVEGVMTSSDGEDPRRYVVISPAD